MRSACMRVGEVVVVAGRVGRGGRVPDKLAPEAISVGDGLLCLSSETGVNLCCDLSSALPAALT